ncbi:hypothetical protein Rhom172_1373 [Rhodothermus marinus SG0.5JP17-172]|nr:hypothetical protein Rhom172_1373 [Rhodothermus marinus SG0.5JP17-172]
MPVFGGLTRSMRQKRPSGSLQVVLRLYAFAPELPVYSMGNISDYDG